MQTISAWTEIPARNIEASAKFYAEVFQWKMDVTTDMGPDPMAVFDGANVAGGGHVYQSATATGPTVHYTLPDSLEAGIERLKAAGGEVIGEPVNIPDGRFVYALDLDGNSIGLFEVNR